MAGGAGIYMSSSLNALPRSDLNFDSDGQLKSCWVEISSTRTQTWHNRGMYIQAPLVLSQRTKFSYL